MKNPFSKVSKMVNNHQSSTGLTLVELLVVILISAIVISVAGSSVVAILAANKKAEVRIERRIDLSRAFDFMTNEIRMARSINRTGNTVANGITGTVEDVVTASGLNPTSFGTIVLYLEIPITSTIPVICPAGGPNAGLAPPTPTNYDRVVYDIRSSSTWLGPRVIARHGRIPRSDGTINPCSNPVANDVLVDSISDTPDPNNGPPSTCPGAGGFYACVSSSERQVDFYLNSEVAGAVEAHNLTSKAASRLRSPTTLTLSGTRQSGTNTMNLSWTWTGSGSVTFKLYRRVGGGTATEVYSGPNLNATNTLTGNAGEANCYAVTATAGSGTIASNGVCQPK